MLGAEDAALTKAPQRPDVRAAEEAWHVAQQHIRVSRGDLWPNVSLGANYYIERAGVASDVDWDMTLQVNVPMFQGGTAVAGVRAAESRARQAKLRWERVLRMAQLDIRNAYAQVTANIARHAALTRSAGAAEKNYQLQLEDYQHNLVNNLEVLQTLRDLQEARRDMISATYTVKRLFWRLRAATGDTL